MDGLTKDRSPNGQMARSNSNARDGIFAFFTVRVSKRITDSTRSFIHLLTGLIFHSAGCLATFLIGQPGGGIGLVKNLSLRWQIVLDYMIPIAFLK